MANYHISNAGNDANTGLSEAQAWATDAPLQAIMSGAGLDPNDSVLRRAGDEWYIDAIISIPTQNDGTSGNQVDFNRYGSGNDPIISNLRHLTGFVSIGGNLWELTDLGFDYPNLLKIDGQPRAKTLNNKLFATSNGTVTTIVSTQIPAYDYSGGEVEAYVERVKWVHDTAYISTRVSNTLTIENTSSYDIKSGAFFIIQNAIETLVVDGNWMYSESTKKLTIYSLTDPNARNIEVSQKQNVINALGNTWNAFNDLQIIGSNFEAFRTETSNDNVFEDLTFKDIGGAASVHWTSLRISILNSLFDGINGTAISLRNSSATALIQGNTIRNVFSYLGGGRNSGDNQGYAIIGNSDNTNIIENIFENIGYIGIRFGGTACLVQYNFIDGFCAIKHDGGGIYSFSTLGVAANRIINKNIIIGPNTPRKSVVGLYIDDNCSGITLTDNTIIDIPEAGTYIHNSETILFSYNKLFNCKIGLLIIHNAPNNVVRLNEFISNQVVFTERVQLPYVITSDLDDLDQYGDFDNNTFIFCTDREFVAQTEKKVGGKKIFNNFTFDQWQSLGYDLLSTVTNLNIPEYTNVATVGLNKFQGNNNSTSFTVITYPNGSANRSIVTVSGLSWLEAKSTSESATTTAVSLVFTQLGILQAGRKYRIKFKAFTNTTHQSINCYLNATDSPYFIRMTDTFSFVVTNVIQEFEIFLDEFEPFSNCAFLIDFQSYQGSLFIRDVEIFEITGTKTDFTDYVDIVYNNQLTTQNVALPSGTWKDIDDNILTSPISLTSFDSKIIFSTDEPPVLEFSLSFEISNGTATANPSGPQPSGTVRTLTAVMDSGYDFDGWYLDNVLLSMSNPYSFTQPAENVVIEGRSELIPVPVPETGGNKCKTYINGFFFEYDCDKIEDTDMTVRGIKYKVLEDLEYEPVTVEFLKQHIRVDFDMDDSLITNYLKSARQTLEKYGSLSFGVKKIRFSALNLVDNFPLDYGPITEIVDETYELFGDTVVDAGGEKITFDFLTGWEPELPEDIKVAICQYAAGLYANRENILSGATRGYMDQAKKVIDGYRNYHVV